MATNRIKQLQDFLKDDPDDNFSRFALALEYQKENRLNDALEIFSGIRKSSPDYVGVYYHLGKLYEKLDQPDNALETYKAGIAIAQQQNDQHAANELQQAKEELQIENE